MFIETSKNKVKIIEQRFHPTPNSCRFKLPWEWDQPGLIITIMLAWHATGTTQRSITNYNLETAHGDSSAQSLNDAENIKVDFSWYVLTKGKSNHYRLPLPVHS